MQKLQTENIKLLLSHLDPESLAHRLVTKCDESDGKDLEGALNIVLATRLAEVRDGIKNAANKLG